MRGRYRLTDPTLAMFAVDGHHEAQTLPVGTVVDLNGKPFNGERLMEVVLSDGRKVMMFTADLKVRTAAA